MENNQPIVFDENICADFIFNKLIERGLAVRTEDIRTIMDLEYEYGESIGIYPQPGDEESSQLPQVITIMKELDGISFSIGELDEEEAIAMLQKAINTIKSMK